MTSRLPETKGAPRRGWRIPDEIRLAGDRLLWSEAPGRAVRAETYRELLDQFVALAEGEGEEILEFARKWGVLELCEHGGPATHPRHGFLNFAIGKPAAGQCAPLGLKEGQPYTPLAWWRYWARRVRAVLKVAASIHGGEWEPRDWRVMCDAETHPRRPGYWRPPRSLGEARREFAHELNQWLDLGARWLWFNWTESGPFVQVTGGSLFSAIVAQLLLACSATEGLALCSGCGGPYVPSRLPALNRRRYCQRCRRRGVPSKHAAQDYRRRIAKAPAQKHPRG